MSDFLLGIDNFELDESRTTRTSLIAPVIGGVVVAVSAFCLMLGINPKFFLSDSAIGISGNQRWNTFGWVLGAVIVPLVVVFAHQLELRRALSPDHIKVSNRTKVLGVVLVVGLVISTLHAFLGSAIVKYGA
jgi:hypothetical protein